MKPAKLNQILDKFRGQRVLVIGDIMIDHYIWGDVDRISPEAPVPVVDVVKEEYRLGGAANVALNVKNLQAVTYMIGVTGEDIQDLSETVKASNLEDIYLIIDKLRPTTLKSRVIADNQQVVRIDRESKTAIPRDVEDEVITIVESLLANTDAIILEDYNKGMLTPRLIKSTINLALQNDVIVCVDPKFKNFYEYENCTLFKPNILELQKNSGIPIEKNDDMDEAARIVQEKIQCRYLIVTRGKKGLSIYQKNKKRVDIPTFAREIYDVSGAGDTVIGTVTLGLCSGLDIEDAALIANHAAGAVCSKVGINPVTAEEILNSFNNHKKRS